MDELALVEAAVLVLVEHLDKIACHVLVEAHLLLDDGDHFFGTQNSVATSTTSWGLSTPLPSLSRSLKHDAISSLLHSIDTTSRHTSKHLLGSGMDPRIKL